MKQNDITTRVKILTIPQSTILTNVMRLAEYTTCCHPEVPEGVDVVSVHYNYERCAFDFLIRHKSFERVSECGEIPRVDETYLETNKYYKANQCHLMTHSIYYKVVEWAKNVYRRLTGTYTRELTEDELKQVTYTPPDVDTRKD